MSLLKIPVSTPYIGKEEKLAVLNALEKGEISGTYGEYIEKFEKEFAKYCGCEYGIATTSGTTSLHLALATIGIKQGDEVLVSVFTNMATFFAVHYQGAKPIPIDIEEDTWNLNPALLEEKITARTKAIIAVHIYGHPVDMGPVLEIAKKHNLFLIEDAAEAHGAEYKGRKIGSFGDIACFSFYANKIIAIGEGGMLITNNKEYAERARSLGSLAYGKENKFMHTAIGFNYRLTNLQAALGYEQLQKIKTIIEKKREIAEFYLENLRDIKDLQLPVEKPHNKNVYWMFHIVLKNGLEGQRTYIMNELQNRGIETRPAFIPYSIQEDLIKLGFVEKHYCPVAERISKNGFYLPSGPILQKNELLYIVENLKNVLDLRRIQRY